MSAFKIPLDVTTETFTYRNGKAVTIYRQPSTRDGPYVLKNGERGILAYEYASYVFLWPRGATQLNVGHGTIRQHMELWKNIPIAGRWAPETLTSFAHDWSHRQFEKWGG